MSDEAVDFLSQQADAGEALAEKIRANDPATAAAIDGLIDAIDRARTFVQESGKLLARYMEHAEENLVAPSGNTVKIEFGQNPSRDDMMFLSVYLSMKLAMVP